MTDKTSLYTLALNLQTITRIKTCLNQNNELVHVEIRKHINHFKQA